MASSISSTEIFSKYQRDHVAPFVAGLMIGAVWPKSIIGALSCGVFNAICKSDLDSRVQILTPSGFAVCQIVSQYFFQVDPPLFFPACLSLWDRAFMMNVLGMSLFLLQRW